MRLKLLFSILVLCAFSLLNSCYYVPTTYPHTAQVVYLNYHADTVTVKTATGLLYTFDGTEDYILGDLVSLIMDSNGTPNYVKDDLIIDVRYSGYTSVSIINQSNVQL